MKKFIKYAAVGVAGYLLGSYRFKLKMAAAMASVDFKTSLKNHTDEEES